MAGRHWQGDERWRGAAGCSSVLSHPAVAESFQGGSAIWCRHRQHQVSLGQEGPPGLGMLSPRCRGSCWGAYHPLASLNPVHKNSSLNSRWPCPLTILADKFQSIFPVLVGLREEIPYYLQQLFTCKVSKQIQRFFSPKNLYLECPWGNSFVFFKL